MKSINFNSIIYLGGLNMSEYIERTIEKTVLNMANTFPVVMITGPRQVGKTTLLNMMMQK